MDDPLRLLIVPGEHLAYLPWAALLLDDDTTLLHRAVIQIVPSLNLLRPRQAERDTGKVLAYLDAGSAKLVEEDGPGAVGWRKLESAVYLSRVHSRAEFEQRLREEEYDGLYLGAHGYGDGLTQHIAFSDEVKLTAASALGLHWPRSMVFASCFVAKVEQPSGREPFGLAVACMLGGCRTVIGGVVEVEDTGTCTIATDVTIALSLGGDCARALRRLSSPTSRARASRSRSSTPGPG